MSESREENRRFTLTEDTFTSRGDIEMDAEMFYGFAILGAMIAVPALAIVTIGIKIAVEVIQNIIENTRRK